MWDIVMVIALVLCCLLALVMTALRLPGTWLMVGGAVGYGWWGNWARVGFWTIAVLVGLALIGELIEILASVLTARKAGGSRQAAWGGLAGGILGMFMLSFLVPIPIVGTIAGALVGCFAGAMIAEYSVRRKLAQGTRVGLFSALGFVLGMAGKVAIALVMSGVLLTTVLLPLILSESTPPATP